MRTHLALDAVAGVALAATPFVTRASKRGVRHWLPHAIVGANSLALALTTKEQPPRRRRLRSLAPRAALGAAVAGAVATGGVLARRRAATA
jgi:hypothetical protein